MVELTRDPIDSARMTWAIGHEAAGAVATFLGTVRNTHGGRAVKALRYEAYEPMARKQLEAIAEDMTQRWPLQAVAVSHRLGDLEIGEISVMVAVASAHRAAAFDACRHGIERIKADVPIWKLETFLDGESAWVGEEPPAATDSRSGVRDRSAGGRTDSAIAP
jgi:molybdopterin synthase catalytic subunit